jgi:hypothetical protein
MNSTIMKLKTITLLILSLFLNLTSLLGSSNDVSRSTINLGETPWRFSKVVAELTNLALESTITYQQEQIVELTDGNIETYWSVPFDNTAATLNVNMNAQQEISSIRLMFTNEEINYLNYKIEASTDSLTGWITLADFSKTAQASLSDKQTDVNAIQETVGFTEKVTSKYNEVKIKGSWKFFKITFVTRPETIEGKLSISELEVIRKQDIASEFKLPGFDDSKWATVGLPHCYNDSDTYLNISKMNMWKGEAWYRKTITVSQSDKKKKYYLEFKGVNVGAAVYVNGVFIKGNTAVPQDDEVTHVGGFIPFSVDITDALKLGKGNVIAVRISNSPESFFTWPGFGTFEGFGMGWGGIVSPVYLHKVSKIHIPLNSYSASSQWGTYQGAVSANEQEAKLRFYTNVRNAEFKSKTVTLKTEIIDNNGVVVQQLSLTKTVNPNETLTFKQESILKNPVLWYPNGSPYGKPYLYTVKRSVSADGKTIDFTEEKLGIREITWDDDFCYINHHKHLLRGFGYRNIYPALGSAVPAALQWKDAELIANCGANTLRVGHVPPAEEMLRACDVFGIMVILNSGDNEWSLKNEPAISYKKEYDRNAIIAFRNHPSVIIWESNNGIAKNGDVYQPLQTQSIVEEYDSIQPRIVLNRDNYPAIWDRNKPIVVGYTNAFNKVKGSPTLNTEVYGANWEGRASWNIARFDYENEKRFSEWYVNSYLSDIANDACGWIDWMLAETQGEGYTIYLNGMKLQKSLGSSAMDANRFPKLKYRIYKNALWIPFEQNPGVTLQSHWNLSGIKNIDAWSNCPYVELFINNKSWGVREPNADTKQCTWENLVWQNAKVKVNGLDSAKNVVCSDSIETASKPYSIHLEVEKSVFQHGKSFPTYANGSDVVIVTARMLDEKGRWCALAKNNVQFKVEGEGLYCGSSNFYVTEGKPQNYHAPFDTELQMEGGLMRIAIKTTFQSGIICVTATSSNIKSNTVEFESISVSSQ